MNMKYKTEEIRQKYGAFFNQSSRIDFDESKVPKSLRKLIPYAVFWGISDDLERENLAEQAPENLKVDLKKIIRENDDELDKWLARPESQYKNLSDAYIAFSALRMVSDYM